VTHEEVAAWEGFAGALVGAPACSWPPPQPCLTRAHSWPHVMPTVAWLAVAIWQCGTTGHVVMVEKGNVQPLRLPPQRVG
jgi:hypothetical protein